MTSEELFTAVYTAHVGHVRRIAAAQVRRDDMDLVEDLVQEAFARLWVYLQRGHTLSSPAGLLGTMTRRAAADWYRLRRNTRERATDLSDPLAGRAMPAEPSAEDIALLHERVADMLIAAATGVAA